MITWSCLELGAFSSVLPPAPLPDEIAGMCTVSVAPGASPSVEPGKFPLGPSFIPEADTREAIELFTGYCKKHAPDIQPGHTHNPLVSAILYGRDVGLSKPMVREIAWKHLNHGEGSTNPRSWDEFERLVDTAYYTTGAEGCAGFGIKHPDLEALKRLNPVLHSNLTEKPLYMLNPDVLEYEAVNERAAPVDETAIQIETEAQRELAAQTGLMDDMSMDESEWADEEAVPIIEGLVNRGEITMASAPPGEMKTTAVAGVLSMVSHAQLGDMEGLVDPNACVMYVAAEGGQNIRDYFHATRIARGAEFRQDWKWRFRTIRRPSALVVTENGNNVVCEKSFKALEDTIFRMKSNLPEGAVPIVVFDSLSAITMEVNDKALAGMFMRRVRDLCYKVGGGSVIITHPPKNTKHAVAGAGEYHQLADVTYRVSKSETKNGDMAVVFSPEKDRGSPGSMDLRVLLRPITMETRKKQVGVHGETVKSGFAERRKQRSAALGFLDMDFVESGHYEGPSKSKASAKLVASEQVGEFFNGESVAVNGAEPINATPDFGKTKH